MLTSFLITSLGFSFWLWSRGGTGNIEDQPAASPILWLIGAIMILFGLHNAFLVSWGAVIIHFFGGAIIGLLIFSLIIKRFI